MEVHIYTDGACSGNPGPGGWGVILRAYADGKLLKESTLSGGERETTNNRMELTAALMGLQKLSRPCRVTVFSDSKYVIQGMTEWSKGWVRRGWKSSTGDDVKNVDLWKGLVEASKPHRIKWQWVRGHANNAGNIRVDALAVEAKQEIMRQMRSANA